MHVCRAIQRFFFPSYCGKETRGACHRRNFMNDGWVCGGGNISSSRLNSCKPNPDGGQPFDYLLYCSAANKKKRLILAPTGVWSSTNHSERVHIKSNVTGLHARSRGGKPVIERKGKSARTPLLQSIFSHLDLKKNAENIPRERNRLARTKVSVRAAGDRSVRPPPLPPHPATDRRRDSRYLCSGRGCLLLAEPHGSEFSDRICVPAVEYCGMAKRKVGGKPC